MIKKLLQNQAEKVKTGFWLLNQNKISKIFFYLLILFLPTQLGKHFWPNFSFVYGLRLDYHSPTIYFTDLLILLIFIFSFPKLLQAIKKTPKKYIATFLLVLCFFLVGIISAKNVWAGAYGIAKVLELTFLVYFIAINYKDLNKKVLASCVFASLVFESMLVF